MRRLITVALLAIAVPAAALIGLGAAEGEFESTWRSALEADFGPIDEAEWAEVRLVALCPDPANALAIGPLCDRSALITLLRPLAIAGLAIPLGLLVLIGAGAMAARRDRRTLVRLFRPGLVVVIGALAILTVIDGAVVAGTTFLVQSAFLGILTPGLVILIGVVAVVAAGGMVWSGLRAGRVEPMDTDAVVLRRVAAPALHDLVEDLATGIGTAPPDTIVAGLDPTFFVTETPIQSLDGRLDGRTLYVSAPLLRILDDPELAAIVAHELGHFHGEDTAFSRRFYPIYRGAIGALGALRAQSHGIASLALAPALYVLDAFLSTFASAERSISRERELAADAVAARSVSPAAAGTALLKLGAAAMLSDDLQARAIAAVADGQPEPNLSRRFEALAAMAMTRSLVEHAGAGQAWHPFDSHPPLEARLEALGLAADDLAAGAMVVTPERPAIARLGDPTDVEARLTEVSTERLTEAVAGSLSGDLERLERPRPEDPAAARLLDLIERVRGGTLARPHRPAVEWLALADLVLEPATPEGTAEPTTLVAGLAGPATDLTSVLEAGTRLEPVEVNTLVERLTGREVDRYRILSGRRRGGTVDVRGARGWPLGHVIGGLFVVPETDRLAVTGGPEAAELQALRRELIVSGAYVPAAEDPGSSGSSGSSVAPG